MYLAVAGCFRFDPVTRFFLYISVCRYFGYVAVARYFRYVPLVSRFWSVTAAGCLPYVFSLQMDLPWNFLVYQSFLAPLKLFPRGNSVRSGKARLQTESRYIPALRGN